VGSFLDYNSYGEVKGNVWFYEFEVQEVLENWPEKHFRQRKWVSLVAGIIKRSLTHDCYDSVRLMRPCIYFVSSHSCVKLF